MCVRVERLTVNVAFFAACLLRYSASDNTAPLICSSLVMFTSSTKAHESAFSIVRFVYVSINAHAEPGWLDPAITPLLKQQIHCRLWIIISFLVLFDERFWIKENYLYSNIWIIDIRISILQLGIGWNGSLHRRDHFSICNSEVGVPRWRILDRHRCQCTTIHSPVCLVPEYNRTYPSPLPQHNS